MDDVESRGLNLRVTVGFDISNTSCKGLTFSNIGGSAGEKVDAGGVRLAVDREEMEELELEKSGSCRPGESDKVSPDLCPMDREIELLA